MKIKYLLVSSALLLINGNFGITSEPNIKSSQTGTLQQNQKSFYIDVTDILLDSLQQHDNTSDISTNDNTVVDKDYSSSLYRNVHTNI